jgi:cell division protein FtsZ
MVSMQNGDDSLRAAANAPMFNSDCVIKVVGVGGGGGNAIVRMLETGVSGVEFSVMNTDTQALAHPRFDKMPTLNIGSEVSRGLGAGGNPEVGCLAATESREEIRAMVTGADLVFVTAGMGGGTGSGAAPVVAEIAREEGALTVGVVTKPFGFEGRRRMQQAVKAIETLRDEVDTLIIVSNDRLLEIIPENTPVQRAFAVADDVLRQGVVGISEIIIRPGVINVDFADVRSIMKDAGTALMGVGKGTGKTRAEDAASAAISSPLLDFPITNAKGVVFNVIGGTDMTLQEINAAAEVIYDAVDPNANIIFGALIDETQMSGEVSVTVVATGFPVQADGSPLLTVGEASRIRRERSDDEEWASSPRARRPSQSTLSSSSLLSSSRNEPIRRPKASDSNDGDVPDFLSRLRRREDGNKR